MRRVVIMVGMVCLSFGRLAEAKAGDTNLFKQAIGVASRLQLGMSEKDATALLEREGLKCLLERAGDSFLWINHCDLGVYGRLMLVFQNSPGRIGHWEDGLLRTAYISSISHRQRWPVPDGLTTFGTSTRTTIRVVVFGMFNCINQPGYYYLPRGAVLRDAVTAAQGLGYLASWRTYSGIDRLQQDASFEEIHFTRNRSTEEQIPLEDGDRIYFGHEVF